MELVNEMKEKVLAGGVISRDEALRLYRQAPLEELTSAADQIRSALCGNGFDLCTIINGKAGRCSENCAFCAQSAHHHTHAEEYGLLATEPILKEAKYNEARGVDRFAVVTAGRALNDKEVDSLCRTVRVMKQETRLKLCVSAGLLTEDQFRRLHEAGVSRVHNNLETSPRFFPSVCTTHRIEDKIQAIHNARAAGMEVCSGGIFGLGETDEDRVDMALTLRDLDVDSVPVNFLIPIPGTPLEHNQVLTRQEAERIVAVYRFILPHKAIRLAGGRGQFDDNGTGCFTGGANALITGDMLTTTGTTIETDRRTLQELGYILCH